MSSSNHIQPRRATLAARAWRARPTRERGRAATSPQTPPRLARLPRTALPGGEIIHVASTFRSRLRGLLGTPELPPDHALLLTRTRSVHTVGMRMPLDLVWIGRHGELVALDEAVVPGQRRRQRGAWGVLETAVGSGRRFAALAEDGAVAMMTEH